jgi:D-beta-D-heptose 7-phosphate kinase/D-beta-D-heptose 1-phosphate adenosyltransferase
MSNRPTIALSGGFDPPTKNHIAMILDAAMIGDVIVILNSDEWCKKNNALPFLFSEYERRASLLSKIPGVIKVVPADDEDGTVCKTLAEVKPDFFGNGGKRNIENTPEVQLCKELGIGMMWFLGNNKDEELLQKADSYLKIAIQETYGNKEQKN